MSDEDKQCRVSIDELNHDKPQSELPTYNEPPAQYLARLRESALFLINGGTIETCHFGRKQMYNNDSVADRIADDFRLPIIIEQVMNDNPFDTQMAKDVFLECAMSVCFDIYDIGKFESIAELETAAKEQANG